MSRSLAYNRRDIAPFREFYGSSSFLSDTGVSLFDCYWFADGEHTDWDEENAYDNWVAKEDILYTMIAHPNEIRAVLYRKNSKNSPNLMIPGSSSRIWYFKKDRTGKQIPVLLYSDAKKEMAVYKSGIDTGIVARRKYVMRRYIICCISVNTAPSKAPIRNRFILAGRIFAMVHSQTDKTKEMISFDNYYTSTLDRSKSKMENLENACKHWDIPYWKDFFNKLFEIEDDLRRESESGQANVNDFADIGVLRDSKTFEIIGLAKI